MANKQIPISDITSIVSYGREAYKSNEVEEWLNNLPEELKEIFEDHIFEAAFYERIENKATPFEFIETRKGFWNKEKGKYEELEYFPEEYTIQELNRLFPGWWTEEMKYEVNLQLRTISVSGYLCVQYPTRSGKLKVSKRWAIGSVRIEYKKDEKDASDPQYRYRAARTEWLKLAGKWYGIGLDVYHQQITSQLRDMFEDRIKPMGTYAQELKDIAVTLKTGKGFRDFLKEIPEAETTERFQKALDKISQDIQDSNGNNIHQKLWSNYIKYKVNTYEGRAKLEKFLQKVEETAGKVNQQSKQNKE